MAPSKLFTKGTILGYKRGITVQHPQSAIVQIEGVADRKDVDFYLGKRVAYIYKAKKAVKGNRYRVIWGKVRRAHGNSGKVRARFASAIPPKAFGATCRIMLYPSRV
eukprot:TRINITY_DN14810_c0_g1_i1.p1 TRINITY_DN14810_c0_g1~~TRINITY_DN14810_c0_g1_i1.p1  ORF type:complete len:107 (-),score=19.86 TRINITY_DN14810_c0_g1_i1:53-373(-)